MTAVYTNRDPRSPLRLHRQGAPIRPLRSLPMLLGLCAAFAVSTTPAQTPSMPGLTLVAPAAPGGGWDQTARTLQQVLRDERLAGQVQVENVPGAAGTIGLARFAASERGRGDALLVTGLVMVSGIVANRAPVTLEEVTPIARLVGEYEVIVVPARSPFETITDLVEAFRRAPAAVSWGGGSAGGTDDILVRLLAEASGVDPLRVNYIAFPGGGAALAALLGSQVTAGVSGIGEFAAQIASGDLRALAVSGPARVPGIDAPTLREAGIDVALANWRAVMAPPGISLEDRRALEDLVARLVATDGWRAARERQGWTDLYLAGPEFEAFLRAEEVRVARIVERVHGGGASEGAGRLYPRLVLAVSLLVGVLLVVRSVRGRAPQDAEPALNRAGLGWLLLALIADLLLFDFFGFVLASAILFLLTARAFGSRRLLRDAVLGLVVAAVVRVTFSAGLGVTLPAGFPGW